MPVDLRQIHTTAAAPMEGEDRLKNPRRLNATAKMAHRGEHALQFFQAFGTVSRP